MIEEKLFEKAKKLFGIKDYIQVIALFSQCIKENPEELNYYWYLGLAYLLQGEDDQAQEIWMSCLLENPSSDNNIEQLIKILEENIRYHLNKKEPDFEIASKIISVLSELDEIFDNSNLFTEIHKNIEFLKKEALGFALSKKFLEARDLYEKILLLYPHDDEVLYQLGMVYFELKDYEQSHAKVIAALEQNPEPSIYYDGLGLILEKTQQFNQSIQAYLFAIEKNKKNTESYIKLANLLKELGLLSEAKTIYQQALDNDIEHFAIYMNYANLLMADEQYEEAVDLYKKAIILKNNYADIHYNLALALQKLGRNTESLLYQGKNAYYEKRIQEAFEYFEQYRLSDQADLDFYDELGYYYQSQRMYRELISIVMEGIKKYPESLNQRIYLIFAYCQIDQVEQALQYANEFINFFKNEKEKSLVFEVYKQGILPIIYNTESQIDTARKEYLENLQSLMEKTRIENEVQKNFAMFILKSRNNYYLHFHGKNDREIQVKYSAFVNQVMQAFYPKWTDSLVMSSFSGQDKIRVGYLCYRTHSLGQLFLGWLKYRNQSLFEIYFYDIGNTITTGTESVRLHSDYYHHIPSNIEKVAQQIRDDKLQILVFLDVGIDPETSCLSALRLAPIQCNTWGHPITSGSSQIDYFLGSDAMEPENAQEHYSETLIRLPNLGITISAPALPKELKKRSEFELSEDDVIYVSCQMTAKYLPQHDYLFCEIVKQVPKAKIVFSEAYENPEVNQKFKARLQHRFEAYNLNFESYCIFTPRVNLIDYLNRLCLADVFLDTLGWSGGFTSVDAIACNLPIVTIPGEFMRGRQSYGMLNIINVRETIAQNELEYIEIAVKLGLNKNWRQEIGKHIRQNKHKLFDDQECIVSLEKFYQSIVSIPSFKMEI